MEFLEGSRGVYKPIRVLFDTPIYKRALQLCWHISSYKCQIAVLIELLRLQQNNQIPSQVTAEDMINLILEESKSLLRERLWEFELEGFDEEEAKPLLTLLWAVNVRNKMRDVECEAKMLLTSPEDLPPNFQHHEILSTAQDYAKILRNRQQDTPISKLVSPREVVLEVIPRVLQGLWVLPPRPLLNMPSQLLSKLSVGVAKATLDGVSSVLSTERQATFSRAIRDDMVLSILTDIRQTFPNDIKDKIKGFAPVLLSKIADVATEQICAMFQPQSPKVPANLTSDEPPSGYEVQEDFDLAVTEEQPSAPSTETLSAEVPPPPAPVTPPTEPPSITMDQAREDVYESQESDQNPRELISALVTPPPETQCVEPMEDSEASITEENPEPTTEPDSALVQTPQTPPAEKPPINVQTREEVNEMLTLETDPAPTRDPDSTSGSAFPVPLTTPAVPVVIITLQNSSSQHLAVTVQSSCSSVTVSAEMSPPPAPLTLSAEATSTSEVQMRQDLDDNPTSGIDAKPTRGPHSITVPVFLHPPTTPAVPVVIITVQDSSTNHPAVTVQPSFGPVTISAEMSPPPATVIPSAEPLSVPTVQAGLDVQENPSPQIGPNATTELDSRAPEQPPAEPPSIQVQAIEAVHENPSMVTFSEPTRDLNSAAAAACPSPLTTPEPVVITAVEDSSIKHLSTAEPVVIEDSEIAEDDSTQGFFTWLLKPVFCCFVGHD